MKPLTHSQMTSPLKGRSIHQVRKLLRRAVRRDPRATTEGMVRVDPSMPPQMWRVANPQHPVIRAIAAEAQRRNLFPKSPEATGSEPMNKKDNDR